MLLGAAKGHLRDGDLTLFGPLEEEPSAPLSNGRGSRSATMGSEHPFARGASMSVDEGVGLALRNA